MQACMKGRDHFGRPRYRWYGSTKIYVKITECGLDSTSPREGPLVSSREHVN